MLRGIEHVDSAIATGVEVASFVLVGVEFEIEIEVGVGAGAGTVPVGVQDADIEDVDSETVIAGVGERAEAAIVGVHVVDVVAEVRIEVYKYVAGTGVEVESLI